MRTWKDGSELISAMLKVLGRPPAELMARFHRKGVGDRTFKAIRVVLPGEFPRCAHGSRGFWSLNFFPGPRGFWLGEAQRNRSQVQERFRCTGGEQGSRGGAPPRQVSRQRRRCGPSRCRYHGNTIGIYHQLMFGSKLGAGYRKRHGWAPVIIFSMIVILRCAHISDTD